MITVGAFEAKTHLSSLLERVVDGDEVVITKHGKPIARLIAADRPDGRRHDAAFAALKRLREDSRLDGLNWKALRDEGRR